MNESPGNRGGATQYLHALGVLTVAGLLCLLLRSRLNPTDIAMVLLLADVVVAVRCPFGPALVTSLASILLFDFAFIEPYYTLQVHDKAYFLTFIVMLLVALAMSRLTGFIRRQAASARVREERTAALYRLNQDLGTANGAEDVLAVAGTHMGRITGTVPVLLRTDGHGEIARWPTDGALASLDVRVTAGWAVESRKAAGRGTDHGAAAEAFVTPIKTPTHMLGVAIVPTQDVTPEQRDTLTALADETARALERSLLAEQHEATRVEIEAERLRTALLSSLSHDLRSPLGSIEGAASLLQSIQSPTEETRRELASAIVEESRRMTRLVSNLLDMIRVESDTLAVTKEWQPLEEALGVALLRAEDRLRSHPVSVELPDDLPLVAVDGILLEQVLINLLENGAKYTPSGTAITVTAWAEADAVVVEVADRGPGVPEGELESIFTKFYRGSGSAPGNGAGLGLTICRGIVTAHGGRIWVERRNGGGTAFRFTLPLRGSNVPPGPGEVREASP